MEELHRGGSRCDDGKCSCAGERSQRSHSSHSDRISLGSGSRRANVDFNFTLTGAADDLICGSEMSPRDKRATSSLSNTSKARIEKRKEPGHL